MVEEPSHVKQLSLNHLCKIGLKKQTYTYIIHAKRLFLSRDMVHLMALTTTHTWLVLPLGEGAGTGLRTAIFG